MSVLTTTAKELSNAVKGKVIMSGIQPTGVFHLGNLLGAVQGWKQLSELPGSQEVVFMVADLHSITVFKPPHELRELRWGAMASLIACGLDPAKCNLYFQSHIPEHSQLHWILSSVASMGYLSRMTQWKAKSGLDASTSVNQLAQANNSASMAKLGDVNLGLFSYPVLQASDVLINDADIVPVGEDQSQHLELTRHMANSFNFKFGDTFKIPQTVLTPYKRVLSLRDPAKKMSKSDSDPAACVFINDDSSEISKKLKKAVTDSIQGPIVKYDPENRPAVSNLVLIASGLLNIQPQHFLNTYKPQNHMQLKQLVSEVVNETVQPIHKEYNRLVQDRAYLELIAKRGELRARERTSKIYEDVAKKVGF